MPIVEQSVIIKARIDLVYQVSQDYDVRYEWDPFPEKISMIKGSYDKLMTGNQVLVHSKLGMQMLVEFVQVAPPKRAAIKMLKGPWFLDKFAGSWIFESLGPELTDARFRYTIHSRAGIFSGILDRMASFYFTRTTKQRLAGLKQYCEKIAAEKFT